jgi:hypothetical protein
MPATRAAECAIKGRCGRRGLGRGRRESTRHGVRHRHTGMSRSRSATWFVLMHGCGLRSTSARGYAVGCHVVGDHGR